MNQKRLFASSILAVATILASVSAQASVVNLTGYKYGGPDQVTASIGVPGYGPQVVNAGEFQGTLDGNPFSTFCADLFETFSFNTNYNYTAVPLNFFQIVNLGKLFTAYYAGADTVPESAAFQTAIWEILYDTDLDVSTGNFKATGADTAQAQTYLTGMQSLGLGDILYTVSRLENRGQQDFLTWINVNPQLTVPEPSSLALFGIAAFGGLAATRKRIPAKA
jgi:PEP-CTERM motif